MWFSEVKHKYSFYQNILLYKHANSVGLDYSIQVIQFIVIQLNIIFTELNLKYNSFQFSLIQISKKVS